MSELPRTWEVHLKGDLHYDSELYELSVITRDNKLGRESWGWGGVDKIILFDDDGGNQLNPHSKARAEFALKVAHLLADALNAEYPTGIE